MKMTRPPIFAGLVSVILLVSFSIHGEITLAQNGDGRGGRDKGNKKLMQHLQNEKWRRNHKIEDRLKRLDVDKSGVLEKNELDSPYLRKYFAERGIDIKKSITVSSLIERVAAYDAKKKAKDRAEFESKVGPRVHSFGVDETTLGVSAFGTAKDIKPNITTFEERLTGLRPADFDEKILDLARRYLSGYDRDKSGVLEGDEIAAVPWGDPPPTQNDLNSDGRISLLELAQRLADSQENQSQRNAGVRQSNSRQSNTSPGAASTKPTGKTAGRSTSSQRTMKKNTKGSRGKGLTGTTDSRSFVKYVDGMFSKYDSDKDQKLSQSELKKMRRPFKGDADNDGFISKQEAIQSIQGGQESKTSKSSLRRNQKSQVDSSAGKPSPVKPSNDTSRVRQSLGSLDTNADGQIQMAEFSSNWDEKTLQKFRAADSDRNGIITADEWAKR